ncbi:hypothetical protein ABT173_03385 [Streptomyces sp. NPDC001795]|uniref:hypothetical protein n=1 Tax=Streptomyces sp. NPDC001795 TaxID=3154525 RepID=UPI003330565C
MASTRPYVADADWEAVETYIDGRHRSKAAPCARAGTTLWPRSSRGAAGIVTSLLVMLGHLEEDRTNLAAWQARTGALITTRWAVVDTADSTALRRPAT